MTTFQVYKEILAMSEVVDERRLSLHGDVRAMAAEIGRTQFMALCDVLKLPEYQYETSTTKEDEVIEVELDAKSVSVPATWLDHLKHDLVARFPKLGARLHYRTNEITVEVKHVRRVKVTNRIEVSRMCPHHSRIAGDEHCVRFMTEDKFPMPMTVDALSDAVPLCESVIEEEFKGRKPYAVEVSRELWAEAGRLAYEYYDNSTALARNRNHMLTMLADIYIAFGGRPSEIMEWPWQDIPGFEPKLFGIPLTVNKYLPGKSWRLL